MPLSSAEERKESQGVKLKAVIVYSDHFLRISNYCHRLVYGSHFSASKYESETPIFSFLRHARGQFVFLLHLLGLRSVTEKSALNFATCTRTATR